MNPVTKTVISALVALLTTYSATATTESGMSEGFSWPAAIAAVVAALNATANLFVKKPTQQ